MTDPIHLPKLISDEFGISRSEARRLIVQGAVAINGVTMCSADCAAQYLKGKTLTVGKRRRVEL